MWTERRRAVLRLDAATNALAGLGLVASADVLHAPLGLDAAWPVVIAGLALAAYGLENLLVARRPTATGLRALITVDLGFAAAALAVALADPTGAETWLRWSLVAVADLSAAFGVIKLLGLRRAALG